MFYAESTFIQSRLSYLEAERQKQYLNEVSKEARAQTEETIEEYQNKYIKHRNEHEDYAVIHVHKIRFQYKNGKPTNNQPAKLKYDVSRGVYEDYIEEFKEDLFE